MAVAYLRVAITGNPTLSELQHVKGLVEKIQVKPNGATNLTVTMKEYQTDEDGDEVEFDISAKSGISAKTSWQPVTGTVLPDGSEADGESHIPVRSPWRINVAGDTEGSVDIWVTFDQG